VHPISYLQALILGLTQGIAEPFPISSLGHGVIIPGLFGWNIHQNDDYFLAFLVATHCATALVLFFYFLEDWLRIFRGLGRSLRDRGIEAEYVAMAQALGMGLTAWSPLAGGLLTGKYRRTEAGVAGEGRIANPDAPGLQVTDRDWAVVEALREVAAGLGRPMAEVALAWALAQPGITSLVIGASSARQLDGNLAALDLDLPADALRALDEASRPAATGAYGMFTAAYQSWVVSPGLGIGDEPESFRRPVWNGGQAG